MVDSLDGQRTSYTASQSKYKDNCLIITIIIPNDEEKYVSALSETQA